ncbi:MAG: hypothetical protein K2M17_06260, partial [Bacilli bacterium]|nr:hypothetical protein [Bacilli bacterium]
MIFDVDLIQTFRDDLCKDQREIKVMDVSRDYSITGKVMRKFSNSIDEFHNEIDVMAFLREAGMQGIPKILSVGEDDKYKFLDIEYYDGIRVYNLLAYLREFAKKDSSLLPQIKMLKESIMSRCLQRQIELQTHLKKWAEVNHKTEVYPQEKLFIIVRMLCRIMNLNISLDKSTEDLNYIINEFNRLAVIPFRDSTTKNMVI